MADISAWSPVDESNTAAPPNGWPEFMQNSMVNNSARAMMGAIRRFYDQVIAGTLELPYLKLSGGSVAGSVSAVEYQLSGVAFVYRDPVNNYHALVDADGYDAAIYLGGAASGYRNIYRAEQHFIQSNNGGVTFATLNSAGLTLTQNFSAAGSVTAASVTASGTVTGASLTSSGSLFVAGSGEINGDLAVAGTVFAHAFVDTDGVLLMDTIAALEARIAALEAA